MYTPTGGEVHSSVQKSGNEIQVSVKDNGIGISAGNVGLIFDRFYRVDKSCSRAGRVDQESD
jgi:signal transduction histidine kinase